MTKSVKMLNTGTDMLDEILKVGKHASDSSGVGFKNKHHSKNTNTKFVPAQKKPDPGRMWTHHTPHQRPAGKEKFNAWRCHYCGKNGHIKPFCYKLYGYPKKRPQVQAKSARVTPKKMWKPKVSETAHIAHTSLRASSSEDWYFDSGCSRHMIGVEKFLINIKPHTTSFVTFGDGAKGEIRGSGKLSSKSLPDLDDVLLVKGLKANLISISQLCDQGLKVNFTKNECLITSDKGEVLMKGSRSRDNCYLWIPEETAHSTTCLISQEEEVKLWHQRLGHLNLKGMKKIVSKEAIRGLPKLKIVEGSICGECQVGKQV
jgi:hypothetical protein